MKPEASAAPTRLAVRRQFDPHRLAEDFQTRAYEQVLALVDHAVLAARMCESSAGVPTTEANRKQEGVAA